MGYVLLLLQHLTFGSAGALAVQGQGAGALAVQGQGPFNQTG